MSIAAIERRRRDLGVPLLRLLRAANVNTGTWYAGLRTPDGMREATRRRLADALDALTSSATAARPPSVLLAMVRMVQAEIALRVARNKALRRDVAGDAGFVGDGRLRRLAVYVVAVELEVENAELARALACSRQNIQQARNAVEDWRSRDRVDALLEDMRTLVRG